jgi:hypothetical protein
MRYTRLYFGGYDLSGDSRTFGAAQQTHPAVNMSGWSSAGESYLADRPTLGITGYQALMNDTATTGAFTLLKATPQNAYVSMLFGGSGEPEIGDPAYLLGALQPSQNIGNDGGAMVIEAEFALSATTMDAYAAAPWGYVLSPATSISSTTTHTSVDLGTVAMPAGAHALLHLTASSGGTWAMIIEHSTDDAAFSTLMTFTANGSAITAERQTAAGTINRYVRFKATRTSGSITPVVVFAPVR